MNATPVSLLRRVCSAGDPLAWNEFVELLLPLLWKWIGRLKLTEQDAADLIQETFLVLFKELPDFEYDPHRSFRAWLWTILKRRAIDLQRRQQPLELEPEQVPAVANLPLLEESEFRSLLMSRALAVVQNEFAPQTWRAFWEHVIHERPAAEVAAELGIAPGSVYVAKGRVLNVLRERLHDMLG